MSKRRKHAIAAKEPSRLSEATYSVKLKLLCAGLLVVATLVSFWPLTGAEFTTWDDARTIWKNWALNPPTSSGLAHHWRHPHMSLWVPVTYTVWWLAALVATPDGGVAAGTLDPRIFHTLNLLLHVASSLLVFRILLRLIRRPWVACAGAMLFALHPLQVETVGWASGTKDLLFGFFSLAAIDQYLKFAQPGEAQRGRRMAYALAMLAFVLALLSKPTAVVLPLIVAVIDLWIVRRPIKTVALAMAPWMILAMPMVIVTKLVQPAVFSVAIPWWQRPFVAGDALAFYLYKLVVPLPSGVDYGRTPQNVLDRGVAYWSWLAPVAMGGVLWIYRRRIPEVVAGGLIALLGLTPLLGLVSFDFQQYSTVADHYMYLPMFGVAIALSFLLAQWQSRRAATFITAMVLVTLGGLSWFQTRYWRDTRTLFEHALVVNPQSAAAHNSLAAHAIMRNQPASAVEHASRAIELAPRRAMAYVTRGSAYAMQRNLVEAEINFRRAVELAPDDSMALGNLSGLLGELGKFDEALPLARRAVEIDPTNVSARINLGSMLAQLGHWTDAAPQLEAATRLDPRSVQAHSNLGTVLLHLGRIDRARSEYEAALRIDPNFPPARQGLADVQKARQSPAASGVP